MKVCKDCNEELPVAMFYRMAPGSSSYRARCKPCHIEWTKQHPSNSKEHHKNSYLKNKYSITLEHFNTMLEQQDGECAVCGSTDPGGRGWAVDHDHSCCSGVKSCGRCVRGILCCACNAMLGMAKDSPRVLLSAVDYLEARNIPA